MTFLKTREPAEIETSVETEVEGEIREFVRRDVVGARRQPESDSELVANNINQLLQRVAGTSVQAAQESAERCTADPGPPQTVTIPGLQRTTSCCAAPGTRS